MELNQVQGIGREIPQAVLDPRRKVLAVVAFRDLAGQASARFRRNNDFLLAGFLQIGNQALAASKAVDVSGVEEIDSAIDSSVECGKGVRVGDLTPIAAYGPRPEADFRNLPTGATE